MRSHNMRFKIGDKWVGDGEPPFIIAEMSGNHRGSLEEALRIIDAAAESGAHAIKLQTYTPDTMTIDCDNKHFIVDDKSSLWKGYKLYDLYKVAHTPWDWHKALFDRCRERGILCFSTPFDPSAVDFLSQFSPPAYKIASFENADHELLKKVAAQNKPIIISTGLATLPEICESIETLRAAGCRDLIVLKCTSSYPANPASSNLLSIPHMRSLFNCPIGLSDHTKGIGAAIAATALGAAVIEKHFTIDRANESVDSEFSLDKPELAMLVRESVTAQRSLGEVRYGRTEEEIPNLKFRRSIFVIKDMAAGESFNRDNVRSIRPGYGLEPKFLPLILEKKAAKPIKRGTPLSWDLTS